MIEVVAALPRNGDLADQSRPAGGPLGDPRRAVVPRRRVPPRGHAIRDTASSVAELALAGKAKELPDIGKTIEAKIVEVVETGDMEALAKRRAEVPGEVCVLHASARPRPEDGGTDLAGARRHDVGRAEGSSRGRAARARSPGMGAATEAKILKALADGQGADEPRRGLLGPGLPVVREVVETLREPSGRDRRIGCGKHAPAARDLP